MGKTFRRYSDDYSFDGNLGDYHTLRPNSRMVKGESRMDRIRARREKEEMKLSSLSEDGS